jgi:hypothetical protein
MTCGETEGKVESSTEGSGSIQNNRKRGVTHRGSAHGMKKDLLLKVSG